MDGRHWRACGFGLGRWPCLDVVVDQVGAIALYESCGWTRLGQVGFDLADGNHLDEWVYLGPRPGSLDATNSPGGTAS